RVTLRDLGTHRLRDLLEPERVFQVVAPDLPVDFPPLRSLERHPTNLPVQPTPMIGRAGELQAVSRLVQRPDVRLVTLTGVGGVGKTRLGLQAASDVIDAFEDGVFFVDLSPLSTPELVLDGLVTALGLRQTDDQSLLATAGRFLGDKRVLLVLDNFEHLIGARSVVADLLAACPNLTVLVTSRARLGLRAEHEYRVPPFPLPDPGAVPSVAELTAYDAVQLFVQRATAARSDFALTDRNGRAIAEICAWLEGLPLAIELAAARVRMLPPEALRNRLQTRLKALTGGAHDLPERQRTIRATIAWSYELLAAGEQALFRRLAVFAGGFTLEAAEVVAQASGDGEDDVLDGVGILVDQSLLREASATDGESRFVMLEMLREFGVEELRAHGEEDDARRRHADHYATLTADLDTHLTGDAQQHWLAVLEMEHDNLRAAFDFALAHGDVATAQRMGAMMWRFWSLRGHIAEGRSWLARALEAGEDGEPGILARVHYAAGMLAEDQNDLAAAERHYRATVGLAGELGDDELSGRALDGLGNTAHDRGDYARAEDFHARALDRYRAVDNPRGRASALGNLGAIAFYRGDFAAADARWNEALATMREIGDRHNVSVILTNLGASAMEQGDLERSRALHAEAIAIQRRLGDKRSLAFSLINLGNVARARADQAGALALFDEAIALAEEVGDVRTAGVARIEAGCVSFALGDRARAARELTAGLANLQQSEDSYQLANAFEEIAGLVARLEAAAAVRLFAGAARVRQAIGATERGIGEARAQQAMETARAALGDAGYARAWSEGQQWSLAETATEALRVCARLGQDSPANASSTPASRS
ncbi:MAG TPA: tetratricopeptide repeat protein, partial [Thermomicrobiales bacterium]|nr:tetratricopeptide repeat protein [Thermomicrobiales bacterium]